MPSNFRIFRNVILTGTMLAVVASVPRLNYGAAGGSRPVTLKCEYASNPLGIDVREPRFSWVLEHTERGQTQSAYQVLVATQSSLLDQDKGDQWDSGKVASDQSTQVVYGGKPLVSGRTYYWKVRYWDRQGAASPYSESAQFEMALLSREEWKGQWIEGGNQLRHEFTLNDRVVRARAYITALGYYELRINGKKIGPNVLDPGWTSYQKRVLYTTYDVTADLAQGSNAVGVMLGRGWAAMRGVYKGSYASPAVLLQMNVELAGGKQVSIVSSPSWKTASGPILSDSVFDGEAYDARLEAPGWDRPGFEDSSWKPAQTVERAIGVLSAQMMPPIRVVDTIVPIAMTNPQPGVYVYDMGQNFSGWAQLRVSGPQGRAVKLRFAELIYDNGMINRENLPNAKAQDIYILRGSGMETYEPRFTYHGFRYVELTGYPGTPNLDSLRGRVVHTAVEPTGSFAGSKPILNQIQKIVHWGQKSNLHSVPTDCPQRGERQGWLGDAQLSAEEAMFNFDMAAFYSNFIRDIRDVQDPDGTITDTVPHTWGGRPADPAWGAAYPRICWFMYEHYGDRRILEQSYEGLKKYIEYLRSRAPDHILRYSSYGDWLAVEPTPGEFISAAYYYDGVQILAQVAEVLGKPAEAQNYTQLAGHIKEAFNKEFFHPETNNYSTGSQTANALALFLDLVPENRRGAVANNLWFNIMLRHDTHLATGIHGTKYVMLALTKVRRSDVAYQLATRTTYPSWGYMISKGATTVWELWQDEKYSHNHPALGSVGAWFYRALGGINVDSEGAGYRHIRIQPQVVGDLGWASAKIETLRGVVSCSWTNSPNRVTLDASIPVNSDAKLVMPLDVQYQNMEYYQNMTGFVVREGGRVVWEKGQYVAGAAGITGASQAGNEITFDAGSGHYSFELVGN